MSDVVGERESVSERCDPGLQQFVCGLLRVETEYLVREDGLVIHAPKSGQVAFSGFDENGSAFDVAHEAPFLPGARAPEHD